MFRTIATTLGYAKAPKATYMLRHPKKGLKMWAVAKGLKSSTGRKLTTGVLGAGALALAVPVGLYLKSR